VTSRETIVASMTRIVAGRLEAMRRARGLSQRALAEAAGITRQAVGAVEAGRMQPSVSIALRLARALGTSVEALFGDEPAAEPPLARMAFARIAGREIRHRLERDHLAVEPSEAPGATAFVAGCELAVGLLARHAALRTPGVRVLWLPMTNREATAALAAGRVHAAVVHQDRSAEVFALLKGVARYELASTLEGWLLAHGNPLGIRGARDLLRHRARLVNRPTGSAARQLLDRELRRVHIDRDRLHGYEHDVLGQLDAGRAVAQGFADAAIGTASVAHVYGLDFVPLREERCTLAIAPGTQGSAEVRALLDTLTSSAYRRELETFASYDVTRTGDRIA
jgi:putative molybdopterin biosynthesis protein